MEGLNMQTSSTSFTSAMTLNSMGISQVPERFVLPLSQRPNRNLTTNLEKSSTTLPIVDLASLHDPTMRPHVVNEIRDACKEFGFFQVINHGVSPLLLQGALDSASEFFNLPLEEKIL